MTTSKNYISKKELTQMLKNNTHNTVTEHLWLNGYDNVWPHQDTKQLVVRFRNATYWYLTASPTLCRLIWPNS